MNQVHLANAAAVNNGECSEAWHRITHLPPDYAAHVRTVGKNGAAKCSYIGSIRTGYNRGDVQAARGLGISRIEIFIKETGQFADEQEKKEWLCPCFNDKSGCKSTTDKL